MPTTYAHYRFGQEVQRALPPEIKKTIENNQDIFNYGVHGPDILFFHSIVKRDRVCRLGSHNHSAPFREFMEAALGNFDGSDAARAYLYGFICHFALDAYCHGYINTCVRTKGLAHNLIETEFDRFLLERDEKHPVSYKFRKELKPNADMAKSIAGVYPGVNEKEVGCCLKSMKKVVNTMVCPFFLKRGFIYLVLIISGNYRKRRGMIMKYRRDSHCRGLNAEIMRLYDKAVPLAVRLIVNFPQILPEYEHIFNPKISQEKELDSIDK